MTMSLSATMLRLQKGKKLIKVVVVYWKHLKGNFVLYEDEKVFTDVRNTLNMNLISNKTDRSERLIYPQHYNLSMFITTYNLQKVFHLLIYDIRVHLRFRTVQHKHLEDAFNLILMAKTTQKTIHLHYGI